MVIAGYDGFNYLDSVELHSLTEDLVVPACLQELSSLPQARDGPAGVGLLQPGRTINCSSYILQLSLGHLLQRCVGSLPTFCGGFGNGVHSDCFQYNYEQVSWTASGELPAPTQISAYAFHEDLGLVIAGGSSGSEQYGSVISTTDGSDYTNMADLPSPTTSGCLAIYNETTMYLAGGVDLYKAKKTGRNRVVLD